ncbi:hypothetical protein CUN61_27640 [Pseudomonas arsenicoxydans]|uniref:Uncharacterized protein n=1 Tax=Pseudomonas arsenicoxydans TaxID=702115 RepID=A0A4P6G7A1_9PSED|nr:hypothetical protein CUN61_27640 [Pseudomonas arsenicoxydans]
MFVPTSRRRTVCVGMPQWTLRVRFGGDAERPGLHSHAERGNDHSPLSAPPSVISLKFSLLA